MELSIKRIYDSLFLLFFLLAFSSCSSSKPEVEQENKPISNKQEVSIYKDLSSKYKQLFRQNLELRKMLQAVEEERKKEREETTKKINNLNNTITLLELNLKTSNSRINKLSDQVTQFSAEQSNPKESYKISKPLEMPTGDASAISDGLKGDFKTPDSSKSIKTISLLPLPVTKSNSTTPEKTSVIEQPKAKKPQKTNSVDSVFYTKDPKASWQDPDLTPPKSPIQLKIVSGAKKSYQNAFKVYSNRDFKKATSLFNDFLKRYPSDLDADNSQYWIGQCFYQLEDVQSAEKAFRKVLKNYPHNETRKGYKTPDAILMLGRIYTNKKQPIKGRYYFEEVIKRFPNSRSAAKAKREIQAMTIF